MCPVPALKALFGSIKRAKKAGSSRQEKKAARGAFARDASKEGLQ
jgi:hypothetical protein